MKPRVNLADLIAPRTLIVPREAVTLTLAVAREWDRQRALHGPLALPDVAAIELTERGDVLFLVRPPAAAVADDAAALAALLGRLLGMDAEAPRQPVPGGLLITMSRRLGNVELPSATAEGFKAALARFADEDPAALRSLYWRSVRASQQRRRARQTKTPGAARVERRATPEQVSELRRSVRVLERRLFEQDYAKSASTRRTGLSTRLLTPLSAVAAAMVLLVAAALFASQFREASADLPGADATDLRRAASTSVTKPIASQPVVDTVDTPRAATKTIAQRPETRPARVAVSRIQKQRPKPALAPRNQAVAFAGGTRGIAWATP